MGSTLTRDAYLAYCQLSCGKRCFLSEAYKCQEAWERRLKAPILQKIKLDDFFYEIDLKNQNEGKISAVDVDLFANAIQDESHLDELQDLTHKLRLSANTGKTLQSTHHSFIRIFLSSGRHDELLHILNDRINYGIFPDYYCSCLLMDTFIKNKNYTAAAKVGVLQMLQEDWEDPLTNNLALYSCHMYLTSPHVEPWDTQPQEDEPDDGEEIKVRVKYLRNPYFDDHFDLNDPKLLVGKTLASLGVQFPDPVGRTYQLVGLSLYNKWDKALTLLQRFISSKHKPVIFQAGVKKMEELIEESLKNEDTSNKETIENFSQVLHELKSDSVLEEDLHEVILGRVRHVVGEEEQSIIEKQCQVYKHWEKEREEMLQAEVDQLQKQQKLAEVEKMKKELDTKEKILFFFENEEKWQLEIENKREKYEKQKQPGKTKNKIDDKDYIPPEVRRSSN
uniref:28S ribosomal protein S27, mitochondrial n=1 Tax=Timema poppense TaxID=170557 RepID=A0A7R9GW99_TIMPO|nr:unnamed protein product [Timema poppensis]